MNFRIEIAGETVESHPTPFATVDAAIALAVARPGEAVVIKLTRGDWIHTFVVEESDIEDANWLRQSVAIAADER